MNKKQALGSEGEMAACDFLRRKGYKILETNLRKNWGEIDILARARDKTLVFVEVKTMEMSGKPAAAGFTRTPLPGSVTPLEMNNIRDCLESPISELSSKLRLRLRQHFSTDFFKYAEKFWLRLARNLKEISRKRLSRQSLRVQNEKSINDDYLRPEDQVTNAKLKKFQRAASLYVNAHSELLGEKGFRLDLVSIEKRGEACDIRHYENIF